MPDSRGLNLFRADPYAAALSRLYLPAALHAHLLPHLDRLGALAGGRMDELAADADRHPPTLSVRNRAGADESRIDKHPAYVELERLAYSDSAWPRCRIAAARWAGPSPCRQRPSTRSAICSCRPSSACAARSA